MTGILIIAPDRATRGPLESVIAALPEARVVAGPSCDGFAPYQAHANCLIDFSIIFSTEQPKLVIVLGDRYETHAAALAAHFLRVPVAHIHGGESTFGAFDDALRHGITHMARLHFVATDDAARKVWAMTKHYKADNDDCYIVGAPGLDTIAQGAAKRDIKIIVVSYYPETCAADYGATNCWEMLTALRPYAKDHAIFFSTVNSDPGSTAISAMIEQFIMGAPEAASWISPATREQYLHLCEHAQVAVGNSSSLVIELPWLGLPSVIIGDRQNGRPIAPGICRDGVGNIGGHIQDAIDYRGSWEPIYRGGAAEKIAKICREFISNA